MTKALIVDDEYTTLTVIEVMLQGGGYDVVMSDDGKNVGKLVEIEHPDILIIDIFMPDVDGIENIRAIRDIYPDLPILAISSNIDYLRMAKKFGADASLHKPIMGSDLLEQVSSLIKH